MSLGEHPICPGFALIRVFLPGGATDWGYFLKAHLQRHPFVRPKHRKLKNPYVVRNATMLRTLRGRKKRAVKVNTLVDVVGAGADVILPDGDRGMIWPADLAKPGAVTASTFRARVVRFTQSNRFFELVAANQIVSRFASYAKMFTLLDGGHFSWTDMTPTRRGFEMTVLSPELGLFHLVYPFELASPGESIRDGESAGSDELGGPNWAMLVQVEDLVNGVNRLGTPFAMPIYRVVALYNGREIRSLPSVAQWMLDSGQSSQ